MAIVAHRNQIRIPYQQSSFLGLMHSVHLRFSPSGRSVLWTSELSRALSHYACTACQVMFA